MSKEITLKIKLDGADKVETDIEGINDGLSDLDKRGARDAKEALDKIDRTSFNNLRSQIQSASQQMQDFGLAVKNVGSSIQGFGQQLTVGVTLPIIGLGVAAIKTFADVESAVANISTIKPEIDTKQLFSQLNEMSTRVPQTAQQLGDGLYQIFSSINVTQSQGLKLLEDFAKGATAAQTDASTFGTAVLGVMNAYKLSVSEASHVSDVFFNTVNLGVVNGQELATSLGVVTASAKQAGVSFDELGALIVGVTKEGGEASQNINNLANFLNKLPSKESAKAIQELGVQVADSKGKFRPVIDILSEMKPKLDKMTESARTLALQKIFPDVQARQGAAVLLSQLDAVKEALIVNQSTAGAADAAYKKIAATANVQFTLLKNTSVAILAELGSAILPVLQPLIIWLAQNLIPAVKGAVESFKSWSPQMQTVAVGVAAFLAALGPVLVIVGTIITFIGALIGGFGAIAGAIGTATAAFAAAGGVFAFLGTVITGTILPALAAIAPVVLAVVAVLAVVGAAAVALYEAWSTNFGNIQGVVSVFIGMVTGAFDSLLATIQPAVDAISSYVTEGFNQISEWWTTNGPAINEAATTIFAALLTVVREALDAIKAFWADNGEWITSYVTMIWGTIKSTISGVMMVISGIIKTITGAINGDWSAVWSGLHDIVGGAFQAIVSVILGAGVLLVGAVRAMLAGLWSLGGFILQQADKLAQYLIDGLVNGINNGASAVRAAMSNMARNAIASAKSFFGIQSPSKEFHAIGEFVVEGLALGIEDKAPRAKAAAKKLADETIKEFNEAVKSFNKIVGLSPEQAQRTVDTENYQKAATDLKEIIKLRAQLGVNTNEALPSSIAGASAELNYLKDKLKAAEDAQKSFDKSLDELQKTVDASREVVKKANEDFAKLKENLSQDGTNDSLRLQKEIELLGVTDAVEKQRIENAYELLALRQKLKNDGFGDQQIEEAIKIKAAAQNNNLDLVSVRAAKQADVAATKKNADELKKQAEDAQKQIDEIAGRIEDSLNNIFDGFRGGFKKGLSSIWSEVKNFFGGMVSSLTQNLARGLSQMLSKSLFGGTGQSGSSNGGGFGGILRGIFGGGSSGSSSGGGLNLGSIFGGSAGNNVIRNLGGAGSGGAAFGLTPDSLSNIPKEFLNGGRGTGGSGGSGGVGIGDLLGNTGGTSGGIGQTGIAGLLQKLGGATGISGGIFGAGLGASLGRGSATGSILGGIGGGIGGLLGGSILSSVLAGTATSVAGVGGIFGAAGSTGSIGLLGLSGAATLGIGAAIAGVALLASYLLSKNAQRRRDEQARTQYLHDAIGGLSGFDNLISDLRGLRISSESAIAQGTSLGANLRTQYLQQAAALKDKKTREIALRSVSELDFNIAQKMNALRGASDFANAAADRKNRIIPEFATGAYMSPGFLSQFGNFKRRNGMLPGAFTGRDTLPSMLAPGEMVLNPVQQARIISAAGGDVFKHGGIPGYADGVYVGNPQSENRPILQAAPIQSAPANITVNPQFTLVLEGVAMDDRVEAYLLSERGERTYVKVDKKAKLGGKIRG